MRLELEIALEDDAKMIFQNEGTGRRMLSGRMLKLTSDGQKLVSDHESFLKATQWSYLKKSATPQLKPKRDVRSSLVDNTERQKHVFVFFSKPERKLSGGKSLHLRHLQLYWKRLGEIVQDQMPPAVWI